MTKEIRKSLRMPTDADAVKQILREKAAASGMPITLEERIRGGQTYVVKTNGAEEVWTPVKKSNRG